MNPVSEGNEVDNLPVCFTFHPGPLAWYARLSRTQSTEIPKIDRSRFSKSSQR
jgi:hypothetical protein